MARRSEGPLQPRHSVILDLGQRAIFGDQRDFGGRAILNGAAVHHRDLAFSHRGRPSLHFNYLVIMAIRLYVPIEIRKQFSSIPRHKAHARDLTFLQHLIRK